MKPNPVYLAPARDDGSSPASDDPSVGMFEYKPLVPVSSDPFFKEPPPNAIVPASQASKPAQPAATLLQTPPPPVADAGQSLPPPEHTPLSPDLLPPTAREVQERGSRDHYSAEVPVGREHSSGDAAVAMTGEQYMSRRTHVAPAGGPDPLDELYGKTRRTALAPPSEFEAAATSNYGAKFTVQDGVPVPPPATAVFSPVVWTMIKLIIAFMLLSTLLIIRIGHTTTDGEHTTLPLGIWLVKQVSMSPEERIAQSAPPEERPYSITIYRAQRAQAALARYYTLNGAMPSDILQLSEQRFIPSDRLLDGWGNLFAAESNGLKIIIRSSGPNGSLNDGDDLLADGDSVTGH